MCKAPGDDRSDLFLLDRMLRRAYVLNEGACLEGIRKSRCSESGLTEANTRGCCQVNSLTRARSNSVLQRIDSACPQQVLRLRLCERRRLWTFGSQPHLSPEEHYHRQALISAMDRWIRSLLCGLRKSNWEINASDDPQLRHRKFCDITHIRITPVCQSNINCHAIQTAARRKEKMLWDEKAPFPQKEDLKDVGSQRPLFSLNNILEEAKLYQALKGLPHSERHMYYVGPETYWSPEAVSQPQEVDLASALGYGQKGKGLMRWFAR